MTETKAELTFVEGVTMADGIAALTGTQTPRQEARAIWLRAKWARERGERTVERLNAKIADSTGDARKEANAEYKTARSVLSERKTAEAKARKAYDATK